MPQGTGALLQHASAKCQRGDSTGETVEVRGVSVQRQEDQGPRPLGVQALRGAAQFCRAAEAWLCVRGCVGVGICARWLGVEARPHNKGRDTDVTQRRSGGAVVL